MMRLIIFTSLIAFTLARPQLPPKLPSRSLLQANPTSQTLPSTVPINKNYKPSEFELLQNRNARYEFSSNIEDHINDQTQQRSETRNGLNVKGSYSYSDGYYKRTVHYEADENGYRVIGEEAAPLDGPQIDLSGTAAIDSAAHGTHVAYRVQSVPVPGPVPKIIN